jgi:inorganic pyrophosphatase
VDDVDPAGELPPHGRRVAVRIETPRGSFVKRDWIDGRLRVAFVSPVPCPFDYGQVLGEPAADGLGRDAVWLGPRKKALEVVEGVVAAVVRFRDGGVVDDKWVVTPGGNLAERDGARISRFFRMYAAAKRVAGKSSRFDGIDTGEAGA